MMSQKASVLSLLFSTAYVRIKNKVFMLQQVCQQCSSLLRAAESASHDCMLQQQQLEALMQAVNPYSAEFSRLSQLQAESQEALDLLNTQKADLQQQVMYRAICTVHNIVYAQSQGKTHLVHADFYHSFLALLLAGHLPQLLICKCCRNTVMLGYVIPSLRGCICTG